MPRTGNMLWRGRVLLLLILLPILSARSQFEGFVESANVTTDDSGTPQRFRMTIWVKGNMARVVISAAGSVPASTIISRRDKGVVWILDEKEKTYQEIRELEERDRPEPATETAVQNTGKTRIILGHRCEQILIESGEARTEIWATRDLKDLAAAMARGLGQRGRMSASGWNTELSRQGLFPLAARTKLGGTILESSEVVEITPEVLALELFAVPAEYKKQGIRDILEKGEPRDAPR